MKAMHRTLLCSAIVLLLASCTKPKLEVGTTNTANKTLVLYNGTYTDAEVNLYRKKEQYKLSQYPEISRLLHHGDSLVVDVISESHYYIDWFTTDYKYTNWGITVNTELDDYESYDYVKIQQSNRLEMNFDKKNGEARAIFIDGNKPEVKWVAVDYIDKNKKSFWHTLDENARYAQLLLTKDLQFVYEEKLYNGKLLKHSGKYSSMPALSAHPMIKLVYTIRPVTLPLESIYATLPGSYNNYRDTIFAEHLKSGMYYAFIKQQ
jgi:hypothetical protein